MKLLNLCEILYIPIIPEEPPVSQKGSLMKLKIRMSSTAASDVFIYLFNLFIYLFIIFIIFFKKISYHY